MNKKCIGCGAIFQTKDKTMEGFIEKENVFKYYDKIFSLRYFWDLMEKNNVEPKITPIAPQQ